jgi:hypothetical protein
MQISSTTNVVEVSNTITNTNNNNTAFLNICPLTWKSLLNNQGCLSYNWNRTAIVKLFGHEKATKIYHKQYLTVYWFFSLSTWLALITQYLGLFEVIPGEAMLALNLIGLVSLSTHAIIQCDLEIVKNTMLTNFSVISTIVLAILHGLMIAIILNLEIRGIAAMINTSVGYIWCISTDAGPSKMRFRNSIMTHVSCFILTLLLTILVNLGIFPQQLAPSMVTFVSINSIGKYNISIDAYALMNQAATTLCFLELNSILHGRKGSLMFARVNLLGADEAVNEDSGEPDWDELAKKC